MSQPEEALVISDNVDQPVQEVKEPAQETGEVSEPVQEVGEVSEPGLEVREVAKEASEAAPAVPKEVEQPPEPEGDPPQDLDDLSDEVDVRAYEEDPDPNEEYDEDGGFVIKDAEVDAVLETELVLHAAAEITLRNVLPEGAKRARRAPQRYEPVETPVDDVDRPVKRRKLDSTPVDSVEDSEEEEEDEDEEEDDDEEYDEEDEDEESTDSDSEEDDEPIEILE